MTDLESLGVRPMDDESIRAFLQSRGVGVLGLPADGPPYLLPMSFGSDGEGTLYFTYVAGDRSEKRALTERATAASFLVFDAPSPFSWRSVVVRGPIERVPESEWDGISDDLSDGWRPAVFEAAVSDGGIAVYRLDIERQDGFEQSSLPPGYAIE